MPNALKKDAIRDAFSDGALFTAADIAAVYAKHGETSLNANTLLSRIHHLKRKGVIASVSKGIFTLGGRPTLDIIASFSDQKITGFIREAFPHIRLTAWNTDALGQLTGINPSQPITIVETDKEAAENVFKHISKEIPSVYLNPDKILYERYIPLSKHPVVIQPLISEAPLTTRDGITLPTPEKLAVDIIAEPHLYKPWKGTGTRNLYKHIFDENVINKSTLFRYARRRNKAPEVKAILKNLNLEV